MSMRPLLFQRVVARAAWKRKQMICLLMTGTGRLCYERSERRQGFACIKPEGAFYLVCENLRWKTRKHSVQQAKKHNLLLVPGSSFACPGYVRLAYCVSYEMIVRSLAGILKQLDEKNNR